MEKTKQNITISVLYLQSVTHSLGSEHLASLQQSSAPPTVNVTVCLAKGLLSAG